MILNVLWVTFTILHKNNINKNEKTFKNEQRSRDAAGKKKLIQVDCSSEK